MKIGLHSGHWLNRSMDIARIVDEDGYSAAVSITGVEYIDNGQGGKAERVLYSARMVKPDGEEYLSRSIAPGVIAEALAAGLDPLDAAARSFTGNEDAPSSKLFARLEKAILSQARSALEAAERRRPGL